MRVLLPLLLLAPLLAMLPAVAATLCAPDILGPDLVLRICVDPGHPDCLVYADRWGHEGEYQGRSCMVP